MPAATVNRRPSWTPVQRDHGLIVSAALTAGVAITIVVAVALAVWALAPASWQSLIATDQRTDATAVTVVLIWANNLLICCLPVLAGVFAHRLVDRGHHGWARVMIAVAALGTVRSLLVVGLVGGLDPRWLANAAAWWILEVTALSVCCASGWHAFRTADPESASRWLAHGLTFAGVALVVAAVVEVALT